jgi:hypothetical protein
VELSHWSHVSIGRLLSGSETGKINRALIRKLPRSEWIASCGNLTLCANSEERFHAVDAYAVARRDLGNVAERVVLRYLHSRGHVNAYQEKGRKPGWDIVVPELNTTIEVKYDKLADKTGNYAVQTGSRLREPNSGALRLTVMLG